MNTPANRPLLGVNIDHVATLRQARGVNYPDPVEAALICEEAGADGITLHLREDRRHIQDADVYAMRPKLATRMNLELAANEEMLNIALDVAPAWVCFVPEKREELTTEGGLNVADNLNYLTQCVVKLHDVGTKVSMFIDPNMKQVDASVECGADAVELHTGQYAEAFLDSDAETTQTELIRIKQTVESAKQTYPDLLVNAGHGLTRDNVHDIANIDGIYELNIGHAIIADSVVLGLANAVKAMRQAMSTNK